MDNTVRPKIERILSGHMQYISVEQNERTDLIAEIYATEEKYLDSIKLVHEVQFAFCLKWSGSFNLQNYSLEPVTDNDFAGTYYRT